MTSTTFAFDAPVPAEVFQTWVDGRVQDSSTPERLVVRLSGAAAHALAAAAGPRRGLAIDAAPGHDEPGGELGAFFHVVLLRSDLRPVEAWDPVSRGYAALSVPQSTFAFRRATGGRVLMEMKRKHLPPSKNHGDVMFRLAVRLRVRVAGDFPVCVSSPFRILSKQSTTTGRPEPKRKRNPAPTKPFVAPLSRAATDMIASLTAVASVPARSTARPAPVPAAKTAAFAPTASAPAPATCARRSSRPVRAAALAAAVRVAKRAHDEIDDDEAMTTAERGTSDASAWSSGDSALSTGSIAAEEAKVIEAAKASMPRPSRGPFRFLSHDDNGISDDDDDEDDVEEEEDEAGVALASAGDFEEAAAAQSCSSAKDTSSSITAGARTPMSEAISVGHADWQAETVFGGLSVIEQIDTATASPMPTSSSSSSSSSLPPPYDAGAGFSAAVLKLPAFRRCRILSDAAIMAASASGRLDSFDADDTTEPSPPPPAASPCASPQLVPSAMLSSALAHGSGAFVLPQPTQSFATTLRAALVPVAPHDAQHPSLSWT